MIATSKIRLRSKRIADARNDYRWQTDAELAQLDAASVCSLPFSKYFSQYTFDLYYPPLDRHEFAVESLDGKHIGNCVYYNVDMLKHEAEVGIMIGERDYWGMGYGVDAINALLEHVFTRTGIERVYLKTLDWNDRARQCFEKCGFTQFGHMVRNGYSFVRMDLNRKQWEEKQVERPQE